jgi:DNA-binding NarL/FixJ family response regulator
MIDAVWGRGDRQRGSAVMTIRILLADDHMVVRRGLRALLETRSDFSVCAEAGDGKVAVELALLHSPDVAILDISLPILNGIDAAFQIRKSTPGTQILIFTMHDSESVIHEALRAGARGYLLKYEGDEQLIDAVEALSRRRTFFSGRVSETLLDAMLLDKGSKHQVSHLTSREREIVQLIAEGGSNKKIATALGISVKTVETHRSASMRKLKVHSTAELVRYAMRNKIIQP